MSKNPFSLDYGLYGTKKSSKRTLGIRDKQILYLRAKKKCEACGKKIDLTEMHAGHKTAAARGGTATLRNSVCLCARCNKLQGTDSWTTFMKKMGKDHTKSVTRGKRKAPAKKKTVKKKKKKRSSSRNPFGIEPIRIEPIRF